MINDTIFIVNITRYCNYLERHNNWHKTPVSTSSKSKLLELLMTHYKKGGNYIYEVNKYEL